MNKHKIKIIIFFNYYYYRNFLMKAIEQIVFNQYICNVNAY